MGGTATRGASQRNESRFWREALSPSIGHIERSCFFAVNRKAARTRSG